MLKPLAKLNRPLLHNQLNNRVVVIAAPRFEHGNDAPDKGAHLDIAQENNRKSPAA